MKRTELVQEIRRVRLEEACGGLNEGKLAQPEVTQFPAGR